MDETNDSSSAVADKSTSVAKRRFFNFPTIGNTCSLAAIFEKSMKSGRSKKFKTKGQNLYLYAYEKAKH